jgi:hypothetical protein
MSEMTYVGFCVERIASDLMLISLVCGESDAFSFLTHRIHDLREIQCELLFLW